MKDLNLPIIKSMEARDKILSMDEYLEFVQFNLAYCFNRESYLEWKNITRVTVPFVL